MHAPPRAAMKSRPAASAEEVRDFFEDALGFCREEFGESNLGHFTVHMDEETPHAHFGFVPLKDGKLSWKGFFPDKAALGAMQDRFYGRVGALYGLSRGEKRLEGQPARRHKSVAEYKAESRRVQAELDEKAELLVSARAELASANADLASARAQLAECKVQVESFAARFERIKAELAQIAECLSVRGFLGSFKAKLAEFAENPICKAALAAGTTALASPSMNRNEGGSAYPPNPDVKSGSCLIAGFRPLTVIHPSYWNAYKTEFGATVLAVETLFN